MTFPTTGLLDDFERPDETLTTGNWSLGPDTSRGELEIVSFQGKGTGGFANSYWSASAFGEDVEIHFDIPIIGGSDFFITFRNQDVGLTPDGYNFKYDAPGNLEPNRTDNGVNTQLGASIAVTLVDNDKLGAEMIGDTMQAYIDTGAGFVTLDGTRTDTTYTGVGFIGALIRNEDLRFDNFSGGTVAAVGPVVDDVNLNDIVLDKSTGNEINGSGLEVVTAVFLIDENATEISGTNVVAAASQVTFDVDVNQMIPGDMKFGIVSSLRIVFP